MHRLLDKCILAMRWLVAVFLLGLGVGLALYAVRFLYKLGKLAEIVFTAEESVFLLEVLHLLDSALVASLVLMVAVSSWDSLVAKLEDEADKTRVVWASTVDANNLKLKLSASIIAISSIYLLQLFLRIDAYDDRTIQWALIIHGLFLVGGLCLATMEKLEGKPPVPKPY